MDIDENIFEELATNWMESLFELLESEDDEAKLDIDLEEGVMKITIDDENIFVISKHIASKQLWLSSPISGGLHFDPVDEGADWELNNGVRLSDIIVEELLQLTGQEFSANVL
jgi:iron donor protein CyaY